MRSVAELLARGAPSDVLEEVLVILRGYVSAPTAQSVLDSARRRIGKTSGPLKRAELGDLIEAIHRGLQLFMSDPARADECLQMLRTLAASKSVAPPAHQVHRIRAEGDVAHVRGAARQLSVQHGFSQVGQTRLVTAVSELARNIVEYATEGEVELKSVTPPPAIEVVARDRGPGIADLERILGGTYKSRHGMGLGLRGVKRLADRFDIVTAPGEGTTVTFLLRVR